MARAITRRPNVPFVPLAPGSGEQLLAQNQAVEIVGKGEWVLVRVDGREGFVRASELERTDEAAGPAAAAVSSDPIQRYEASAHLVGHKGAEVLAHVDFHRSLRKIEQFAEECDIRVVVTHSFRMREADLAGVVVPPAKRSNHLVGHAIDMNLVADGQWLNSKKLAKANHENLPRPVRYFIGMLRDDVLLRWGGDFVRQDPVHIDDNLYRRDQTAWMTKLASLSV